MRTQNEIPLFLRVLHGIISLALLLSAFGAGRASPVQAQGVSAFALTIYHALSDGQFVYGPNIGDFNIKNYLNVNAPHLLNYADDLYARSEYFSINPKVYLTLLEVHSKLITVPNNGLMEDPFGLHNGGFIAQIEALSNKMSEAYYLHLYTYSPLPVLQRGSLRAVSRSIQHGIPTQGRTRSSPGLPQWMSKIYLLFLITVSLTGFIKLM